MSFSTVITAAIRQKRARRLWLQRWGWLCSQWLFARMPLQQLIRHRPVFQLWNFPPDVGYLNHGSFGAVPNLLNSEQYRLRCHGESNPMQFIVRELEPLWYAAREELAAWLGTHERIWVSVNLYVTTRDIDLLQHTLRRELGVCR